MDGLRVYSRVAANPLPDSAPAVVLVHGYGASSRYMAPGAAHLASFCRVYAPDLPGFGKSDKPDSALNIVELADFLAAWMREIGLDAAILLGNSFGCQITAAFALRYPEYIQGAVLIGPSVAPEARNPVRLILWTLLDVLFEPPALPIIQVLDFVKAGPRRMFVTFKDMIDDRIEDKLPHIREPVLVVRGEHDTIAPQRWAREVARLVPNGRLVVIPGGGHAVNYESPAKLARVVCWFLTSIPQRNR